MIPTLSVYGSGERTGSSQHLIKPSKNLYHCVVPKPVICSGIIGAWRSLVAHLLWEQGAGGSNPLAPTNKIRHLESFLSAFFVPFMAICSLYVPRSVFYSALPIDPVLMLCEKLGDGYIYWSL